MIKIKKEEIEPLVRYIYSISGIKVDESKTYLFETRLSPLLESTGLDSYLALVQAAKRDASQGIQNQVIDAISTNETSFFRDSGPFAALQHKLLPEIIDARSARCAGVLRPTIRIWSAACSTGQEVYSIAIVLKELLGNLGAYNIKLLGADISDAAISQASYGMYNKFEIERGLPAARLEKYFSRAAGHWRICDEIRAMATFRKMNLTKPFGTLGKFDIIFCRNVAIYFPPEDRKTLFERLHGALEPDGYLVIGASESLTGLTDRFVPQRHIGTIVYQPRPG